MRHPVTLATAALLGLTALSALAQVPQGADPATGARPGHIPGIGESLPRSDKASNTVPADTRSNIAPTLPSPALDDTVATTGDYLKVARTLLAEGRTGQAQQALEMATTRALDRSVPQGQTNFADDSRLIARIHDARVALGNGDFVLASELIDLALAT
jgi:hypothetical protein